MDILSPLPGTFYRKPSPEEAVFVEVGQTVKAGDTLGLIEVMKQYAELKAEKDGTITDILVENEGIVEPGQVVIRMEV